MYKFYRIVMTIQFEKKHILAKEFDKFRKYIFLKITSIKLRY